MESAAQDRFFVRLLLVVLGALLVYLLWLIFRPFLGPLLWASLLAFLLDPINARLRAGLKDRRGVTALLMTLLVTLAIVIPAALLTMVFVRQAGDLVRRLSETAVRYHVERPADLYRIPALGRALTWIDAKTPITTAQLQEWLTNAARNALEFLLASSRVVLLGALGALLSLLLMLFILYFFFRDGDQMATRVIAILPAPAERKRALVDYLSQVTRAVVYGSLLTALVQGALVGIAFEIAGLPSPVVFGVVAAVASLLPVGGTAFVWAPGAVALWAQGRWGWAIFLAVGERCSSAPRIIFSVPSSFRGARRSRPSPSSSA